MKIHRKWNMLASHWVTWPLVVRGRGTKHIRSVQGPFLDPMDWMESRSQRRGLAEWDYWPPCPTPLLLNEWALATPVPGIILFKALPTHWVGFHFLLEGGHMLVQCGELPLLCRTENSLRSWILLGHRADHSIRQRCYSVDLPPKR